MVTEPRIYKEREHTLITLALTRFTNPLSQGEMLMIHRSVRPGPPTMLSAAEVTTNGRTPYTVRAAMLRWIVNDHEAAALIDPNGLFIVNTRINEEIDLTGCKLPFNLTFDTAVLTQGISGTSGSFREALRRLLIRGCR